jgi:Domain of unknown function (DUF4232)
MSRYRRAAWQFVAIVAFAGTAALAIVLTRPQPAALAGAVACRPAGLFAWLGVSGDYGTAADLGGVPRVSATSATKADIYYTLEFTNVSGQTCSLFGYPHVQAFDAGHQIGSPAITDTSVRPSTVTLAPDATAHAVLRYTVTDSFQAQACRQVTAPELRVYPPQSRRSVVVPLSIPACSRMGVEFLSVEPVQPREGIPGFPHY